MTNRELIEQLKDLPPDLDVVIDYARIAHGPRSDNTTDVDEEGFSDVVAAGFGEIERNDEDAIVLHLGLESDEQRTRYLDPRNRPAVFSPENDCKGTS